MTHSNSSNSRRAMTKPNVITKAAAERCAREVVETIPLIMRFIRREMRRQRGPFLSVPQLRTLLFLSRCPGADLSSTAEHLGVSRPTASAIVNRLVRKGLVNRTGHPQKRRFIILTLTRSGSQHLRHAREAACAVVAGVLGRQPPVELQRVEEAMALLGKVFKEVVDSDDPNQGRRP